MLVKKSTAAIAAIAIALGMATGIMTTVPYIQTAVAEKGGVPNESARTGPACDNAHERHDKFDDRFIERVTDGNPNNDNGVFQSEHQVFHNEHGLEPLKAETGC